MLEITHLSFSYSTNQPDTVPALRDISLHIAAGERVAIIGHNGSGKSTLAKLLAAVIEPPGGTVVVDGLPSDTVNVWEIRRRVGMVFQNPDDQLLANTVIDDLAFGPENLGLPRAEIARRVEQALDALGLTGIAHCQISELSAGQKQRVAIASTLVMQPDYLILDEPTSLLNPQLAVSLLDTVQRLSRSTGMAVLHITHFMREVVWFDRVIVMDTGRIIMDNTPRAIFARARELHQLALDVPLVTKVGARLRSQGVLLPEVVLTANELREALCSSR